MSSVESSGWATEDDLVRIVRSELPAGVTFELRIGGRLRWPEPATPFELGLAAAGPEIMATVGAPAEEGARDASSAGGDQHPTPEPPPSTVSGDANDGQPARGLGRTSSRRPRARAMAVDGDGDGDGSGGDR